MAGIVAAVVALAGAASRAQQGTAPAVVSHVLVGCDKVEDVSSLDAWKRSFIKPGMDTQAKALAVWQSVVKFRHQDPPPNEFLADELNVHDPIKCFNVYGYGQCCCASANIEQLARFAGLEARGWGITGHSVPEINIDGHWAMLDASLVNYFKKPDGAIAGVDEISKDIASWYLQHPQYKGDRGKLQRMMANGGWRGGPPVVAGGTGYDNNGWLPAATHAWADSLVEFGRPDRDFLYEYGAAVGYEVNIQLRPGMRLVRNWGNKGLHVNKNDGAAPHAIACDPANAGDQMRYAPRFGDIGHGRVGNGTLEYDAPLANGRWRACAVTAENLACRDEDHAGPALHVADASKDGTWVLRMPCSYVYLGGRLDFQAAVEPGGGIDVFFSDNNGLDFKPVASVTASGPRQIDLTALIFRRYDYRLKFVLRGKGAGLESLRITHDIQHSQRALPILDAGDNHIHFAAGAPEGTITIQGYMGSDAKAKGKNLSYLDFHPHQTGLAGPPIRLQGAQGEFAYDVQTPGDIARVRIGAHYRARDAKDGWAVEISFDAGKTFKPVGVLDGPHAGFSKYFVFSDVPAGARQAQVRLVGKQRNTTCLFDLRIDADYKEPLGRFAPVKVSYAWDEAGQPRQDVHIARQADETYTINCLKKPLMKSIALELAE